MTGKDTVGAIIQGLTGGGGSTDMALMNVFKKVGLIPISTNKSPFVVKKFAGKLKDIICLLIGCTREQLEDGAFKTKVLDPQWNKWGIAFIYPDKLRKLYGVRYSNKEDAIAYEKNERMALRWTDKVVTEIVEVEMTPRTMLQTLGTDCGRDMIHPNIWVNALFADYKHTESFHNEAGEQMRMKGLPSWIVTDMRFINEMEAIKSRGGLTIRVNTNRAGELSGHESETALDGAEFDYTIDNSGTFDDLIEEVRRILIAEKII